MASGKSLFVVRDKTFVSPYEIRAQGGAFFRYVREGVAEKNLVRLAQIGTVDVARVADAAEPIMDDDAIEKVDSHAHANGFQQGGLVFDQAISFVKTAEAVIKRFRVRRTTTEDDVLNGDTVEKFLRIALNKIDLFGIGSEIDEIFHFVIVYGALCRNDFRIRKEELVRPVGKYVFVGETVVCGEREDESSFCFTNSAVQRLYRAEILFVP